MTYRTPIAVLAALTLLAPAGIAGTLVDQLDDGSFEDWENDEPVEWRVVDGEVDRTGESFDGEDAALLNAEGSVVETTIAQEVSLESDDAPIVPNAEYELAFAADLNTGAADGSEAFGQVVWLDPLGQTAGVDAIPIADTNGYAEYDDTFRAPPNASAADVQFHLVRDTVTDPTDANLKVDAAVFGPAEPVST